MNKIERLHNEWLGLQPLTPEHQANLDRKFMLEFNYNSNHIEGNTLTYGQTELLLMFGMVDGDARMHDLEEMKAHNVGLKMMQTEAADAARPLTEYFIREVHRTLLREDYDVQRQMSDGSTAAYTVHAGIYKTRPNSVITITGEKFEYASPEETPALMTDLVDWYNQAAERGNYTPIELASLFHYRYIRIHPFEDGNGRIARLLVNFILLRHNYPMIVVKSNDKDQYLNALNKSDARAGMTPSDGAHAELAQIQPFVEYMASCLERTLTRCIRAAKGEDIDDPDDFDKELALLKRQSEIQKQAEIPKIRFSETEVWNVLEYAYFPMVKALCSVLETTCKHFQFSQTMWANYLSKSVSYVGGVHINSVMRDDRNPQLLDLVRNAKSMWFRYELCNLFKPVAFPIKLTGSFQLLFNEENYSVRELNNKQFLYGSYPTEEELKRIVTQFQDKIKAALKNIIEKQ